MKQIIKINDLIVSYGNIRVIHGISLDVPYGEIRAILGANAAGKSTLVKAILGLVKVNSGSILFDESVELVGRQPHEIHQLGISWVPQGRIVFGSLTVYENLMMGVYNQRDKKYIANRVKRMYELFPILEMRRRQLTSSLSGGEQQVVSTARALMSEPRLLLMDEPSLGLAPIMLAKTFDLVRRIHDEGVTVLLVEQNARQALKIADWAYVLEGGRVVASERPDIMESTEAVRKAYLGR
jgi:branched-chain amino acid transport system ATP-binding protein